MSKTDSNLVTSPRLVKGAAPILGVLDHLAAAVMVLDRAGTIMYVSPAAERAIGRLSRQIIGTRILDLVFEEDRVKARRAFEFVLEKPDIPMTASLRLSCEDGTRQRLEVVLRNHLSDQGVDGIIAVANTLPSTDCSGDTPARDALEKDAVDSLLRAALEDIPLYRLLEKSLRLLSGLDWLPFEPWASVYLAGERPGVLALAAHWGSDYHQRPCAEVEVDHCSFGRAFKQGRIVSSGLDTSPDPACPELCPAQRVSIPIASDKGTVGVLNVCFTADYRRTDRDNAFLAGFASVLAKMIARHRRNEESARLAEITRQSPEPVLLCDAGGEALYGNPAAHKLLRQHSVKFEGLLPPSHKDIISNCLNGSRSTRTAESTVGERVYTWTYHPVASTRDVHVFGRDITERRRVEQRVIHDAMHDTLTGLPNRSLIVDRIGKAMGIGARRDDFLFAVMLLDLDRFAVIMESLGPATGNRVLQEVSKRLVDTAGEHCTVGRLGGDEFVVVLEDIADPHGIPALAEAILEVLAQPMEIGEQRVVVSATAGIAAADGRRKSPEDFLRDAETAMYRAKAEGRGRYAIFDTAMRSKVVARMRVQSDLRAAIDNGELLVHYQPVLGLRDLRIRGFEALVRWLHPTRGMVAPPEFIGVAEETGLIIPLGAQVLRSVCRLLKSWRDSRMPLAWVAVNLSGHQFAMSNMVEEILNIIREAHAPPERLQLEITEGTAAANPERAVVMLRDLRAAGIKVALDDFGTGYSSMAYLKRFPIDSLKLDRSFVKDLPESHDDAAIATTVIAMAQSLGMKTVAEGVENERQAMFLRSRGCDEVQGFLYGRPMSEADATALLSKGFAGSPGTPA